jgi:hypothetical protein
MNGATDRHAGICTIITVGDIIFTGITKVSRYGEVTDCSR